MLALYAKTEYFTQQVWIMKKQLPLIITLSALSFLCACTKPQLPLDTKQQRVISLAPNITEMICAIGADDLLVGRTSACDYPPDIIGRIPIVGGFGAPSIETLIVMRPTLILDVDLVDNAIGLKIDELGLRRQRITCDTLSDIPDAIRTIGVLLNHEQEANSLADSISARIADVKFLQNNTNDKRPSVLIELASDPIYTAGKHSFVAELIRAAGGNNIGDDVTAQDYFEVSPEWIATRNPDVIICLGPGMNGAASRTVMKRAGWKNISAIRSGRVYDSIDPDIMSRPGPRALDGIEQLRALLEKAP